MIPPGKIRYIYTVPGAPYKYVPKPKYARNGNQKIEILAMPYNITI